MRKLFTIACFFILTTACEKEQNIQPSNLKDFKIQEDCGQCTGTWDLTDTIP